MPQLPSVQETLFMRGTGNFSSFWKPSSAVCPLDFKLRRSALGLTQLFSRGHLARKVAPRLLSVQRGRQYLPFDFESDLKRGIDSILNYGLTHWTPFALYFWLRISSTRTLVTRYNLKPTPTTNFGISVAWNSTNYWLRRVAPLRY